MECRCDAVGELYGREAEEYAAGHLAREETRAERRRRTPCPDTGRRWLLDYPGRTERGRGTQARLRTTAV